MHNQSLVHILEAAEHWCSARGEKLTAQRKKVLSHLLESEGACKAYDILASIQKQQPNAAPPTVYRALDFLVSVGLVHKLDSAQSFVPCHEFSHPHQSLMLICDQCQRVTELQDDRINGILQEQINSTGFKASPTHIEIHGTCARCCSECHE